MILPKKLMLSAFVLIFTQAVFASVPDILVTSIDPQPVDPGKDVTIDVTLFNKVTTQDTGDFSVTFQHAFPVVLKSSTNDWSAVSLCSGCKVANKYFLSIDPSAVSGTYPVYFIARQGGVESREQVDIKVQGRPSVIFSSAEGALINKPELLLADEPTAALDSKSALHVMQILRKLNHENKQTIVLITHEENLGRTADRGIWLKDGMIDKEKRF